MVFKPIFLTVVWYLKVGKAVHIYVLSNVYALNVVSCAQLNAF